MPSIPFFHSSFDYSLIDSWTSLVCDCHKSLNTYHYPSHEIYEVILSPSKFFVSVNYCCVISDAVHLV